MNNETQTTQIYQMNTATIRALSMAVDILSDARSVTNNGFVSDCINNSIADIKKAMKIAIGDSDG